MIADVTKFCVINMYSVLVDRTAAHSIIGYCHDTVVCLSVCLTVCLSATMCFVARKVGVGVESCTIVFLGLHFLCK